MSNNSATLSLPEGDASTDDYIRAERVVGSTVVPRRYKPSSMVVTPTGGSARTLAAIGADVDTVTGRVSASTVGTVTTAATTTAIEYSNGPDHVTHLTLTAFAVGTSADNASLGIGAKFYSFPAGTIAIEATSMVGGLTAAISVTTNTPEVGIGTVIASGAVSVLSGTATFEDLMDGNASGVGGDTVAPDVAGGAFYKSGNFTAPVVIKTTGGKARDLFLNCAAAWADVAAAGAVTFTGVITLKWRKVS